MFYVVVAKGITVAIRLVLRRSSGFIALLLDALLDEAAAHLEASLLVAPAPTQQPPQHTVPPFEIQTHDTYATILMRFFFTAVGALLGRHWRAQAIVHPAPPTPLRVV